MLNFSERLNLMAGPAPYRDSRPSIVAPNRTHNLLPLVGASDRRATDVIGLPAFAVGTERRLAEEIAMWRGVCCGTVDLAREDLRQVRGENFLACHSDIQEQEITFTSGYDKV